MVRFRIKPVDANGLSEDSSSSSSDVGILGRVGFKKRSDKRNLLREISSENKEKVLQRYKDTSYVIFEDFVSGKWATDDLFGFNRELLSNATKPHRENTERITEFPKRKKISVTVLKTNEHSSQVNPSSRSDSENKDIENIQIESHNKQPRCLEIYKTPAAEHLRLGLQDSVTELPAAVIPKLKSIHPPNNLIGPPPPPPKRKRRRCIVS